MERESSKANPKPQVHRRRAAFLSGQVIVDALPVSMRPRDPKTGCRNPLRLLPVAPHRRGPKPRKRLITGRMSLKVRKQMLAAILRKEGARTVTGLVNRRQEDARKWFIRKAKRDARRERERQAALAA